jgi:hypothetical protein
MLPQYWIDFLNDNALRGKDCGLTESQDESGEGADLKIFTEAEALDEANNFYPGIAVAPDGYIPVAGCLVGSGNPYFIKASDGRNGQLYRVYHDAVDEAGYSADEAIVVVLPNYELLLKYVESL